MVWFDLDDTLWDFRNNSRISQRIIFEEFNIGRRGTTPDEWIPVYERNNHALWSRYNVGDITRSYLMDMRFILPLREIGFREEEIEGLYKPMSDAYLGHLAEQTGVVEGAVETLSRAKAAGFRIGILSNGFHELQFKKLDRSALKGLYDIVVLSEDLGVNKPDRRLFDFAAEKAGIKGEKTIMIGDNPSTDIAGAIDAGWDAVYLNREDDENPVAGARMILSLDELDFE